LNEKITNTKIYSILLELQTKIQQVSMHIKGNGGKGILQRLDGVETWLEGRPESCPATSDAVFKRIKKFTSIVSAVLGAVLVILVLGSRVLGDSKIEDLTKQVTALSEAVKAIAP
jgi:hypothetical protein